MAYSSYTLTQPYYQYVEYLKYNVIAGIITLTFDSTPSSDPADYSATLLGGTLSAPMTLGFSTVDGSLSISSLSVALTMPVVAENNSYIQISYQGEKLPFHVRCKEDYRYTQPAIFTGISYELPN
jgi:hypothetical protein